MDSDGDGRLTALERQILTLSNRIAELEHRLPEETAADATPQAAGGLATSAPPLSAGPASPPAAPPPVAAGITAPGYAGPPASRPARSLSLEDLLGTRVLAYAGGVAVLVGVTFFVAVAIRRGWIDEPTRIILAFLGSSALLGAGVWLSERHGRTQASLAAVGTGVAALFLTLAAGAQLYQLFPVWLGLAVAFAVGALATAIAIRFDSRAVAALGIVGALLSPVLVGAGTTDGALAFMAVALLSSVGVLVWRRWDWLAPAAFLVSTPQLFAWIADGEPAAAALAVLAAFGALYAGAAVGYEVRVPASGLRASSSTLFLANALVVSSAGYLTLNQLGARPGGGDAWIAAVAVVHLALGAWALAGRRVEVSRPIAILLVSAGVLLGDVAFGLAASGPLLAGGWAVGSAGFAYVLGRRDRDAELLALGLTGHIVLSLLHVLLFDASPVGFVDGFRDLPGAVSALLCLAAGALIGARLVGEKQRTVQQALDVLGLGAVAYLSATALDGAILVAAWAAQAVALAEIGRRSGDALGARASDAFLGIAAIHVLAVEAPPDALATGVPSLSSAALALVVVGAAAHRCARLREGTERELLRVVGAAALVYLASVTIIDRFQPGAGSPDSGIGTLDVRQQGQVLLSGFWSITGAALLLVGLSRHARLLRLGGFGLLGLALAKVFLYDLQTLDSIYRVLSFVGLGLLLLGAAFAYQRLAPEEPGTPPEGPA